MSHLLYKIGNFSGRHPWRVIAAWVMVAFAVVMLNQSAGGQPDDDFRLPGSESQRAADLIQDRFPQQTLYASNVIFHSEGLTSPETKAVVRAGGRRAPGRLPHAISVSGPYDPRGPTVSSDGETAFATVGFDTEKLELQRVRRRRAAVQAAARRRRPGRVRRRARATPTPQPAATAR